MDIVPPFLEEYADWDFWGHQRDVGFPLRVYPFCVFEGSSAPAIHPYLSAEVW